MVPGVHRARSTKAAATAAIFVLPVTTAAQQAHKVLQPVPTVNLAAEEHLDAPTVQQVTTAQTRSRFQVRVLLARSLRLLMALQAPTGNISSA